MSMRLMVGREPLRVRQGLVAGAIAGAAVLAIVGVRLGYGWFDYLGVGLTLTVALTTAGIILRRLNRHRRSSRLE